MRLSLLTLTALTVAVLTSFSNANLHNELEARDIEYFLEQREILDGLSTRELIDELSGRLDRRAGKKAGPKPGGLQYTKTCTNCKKTFPNYGESPRRDVEAELIPAIIPCRKVAVWLEYIEAAGSIGLGSRSQVQVPSLLNQSASSIHVFSYLNEFNFAQILGIMAQVDSSSRDWGSYMVMLLELPYQCHARETCALGPALSSAKLGEYRDQERCGSL
ncbi:hypothetical protein DFP72DRAFT_857792 [Ephemerocybe angulata]|uniref:Uncharacterized protein n=1 Tax=Ephemerocybe angulata TaxID=980116 RepID=A0A8H6LXF0_9AGAR|nr:hypothetical protein DFP72DRAFT_857792 [Tulosesus angulatus]